MSSEQELIKSPTWKHAIEEMMKRGITFEASFKASELASWLRTEPGSTAFSFLMLRIRTYIEDELGYYLASSENGSLWTILSAEQAALKVPRRLAKRIRKDSYRCVKLPSDTLQNPANNFSAATKAKIEREIEHAAIREVLLNRHELRAPSRRKAIKKD